MSFEHSYLGDELYSRLDRQLDRGAYRVRVNSARLRRALELASEPSEQGRQVANYYIPDLCIVPMELILPYRGQPGALEVYDSPLPLVVEVWSPSTGAFDLSTKIPEYQLRGDLEIWFIHPYDRTLRAWRRQPDGSYEESLHHGGTIQPVALPGVTVNLDTLFD